MSGTYTAAEVKKLLNVKPEQLRRLVERGVIRKYVSPLNKTKGVYDKDDVDALVEKLEEFKNQVE